MAAVGPTTSAASDTLTTNCRQVGYFLEMSHLARTLITAVEEDQVVVAAVEEEVAPLGEVEVVK